MTDKKKILKPLCNVFIALAVIVAGCGIYLGDYYKADTVAVNAFATVRNINRTADGNTVVFAPESPTAGLIFYPGGKVEHTAYEPLMRACADKGILCVLIKMPFNLAVFDINAAQGIAEKYPEIESWYIGGHSLGGSMAASYLKENTDDFDGLVLLGSYSTTDLSQTDLEVLSVYGSEDKVLNAEKYKENLPNLPTDFTEIIIDGGCHAYFGTYGTQDGDGIPTISNKEQIEITSNAIAKLVK
ncbi:MAG: alpha/beta hydrolase [Clostridia bacterium]|nr:alpha/beta hydrolase [Clostridia bacterium]